MADLPEQTEYPTGVYVDLQDLVQMQHEAWGFSYLPKYAVHSLLAGKHRSKLRGRGLDFEEVRRYNFGDDIRSIDWKVTARTRKPHTKVYTEERERPVLLIVDQSSSMFFGSQVAMKSVTAAQAAALGAWRVLSQGDRIGGVVFNNDSVVEIKPQRSRKAVLALFQAIVEKNQALRLGPAPGKSMLAKALRRAVRLCTHDYLVVVVSDFLHLDEEGLRHLMLLSRHNDVIAALIYDPLEQALPPSRMVVSDGRSQVLIDTRASSLQDDFATDFETRLTKLTQDLRRYGIPVLPLDTVKPISEQLRRALGFRGKVQRGR